MDWNAAVEKNREALKRVLAGLVAMAGLGTWAQMPQDGTPPPDPAPAEGSRPALPRRLHCAVLRLLRPAEAAARRLVIVAARGLVVPPPRMRKPAPRKGYSFVRNGVGTGIVPPRAPQGIEGRPIPRLGFPLFDPLPRPFRLRRTVSLGVPRISVPGLTKPFPVAPRRPPAPHDMIDAARLAGRLQALGRVLDDLPRQARRFARWQASRDAALARAREAARAKNASPAMGPPKRVVGPPAMRPARRRFSRVWPLRGGRPPGTCQRSRHEVQKILDDVHGLAFWALESPDTS